MISWEECRGIGLSFGYNQNEDLEDYTSPKALVLTLVNIVSNGGNLLLDVGPNAKWVRFRRSCRNVGSDGRLAESKR